MKGNAAFLFVLLTLTSSFVAADALRISRSAKIQSGVCSEGFTGLIPNPDDCHSFYICDGGIPGLTPCPSELCFNPTEIGEGGCEYCELVPGCQGNATRPPPPSTSTGAPSTPSDAPSSSSTSTEAPTEVSSSSPPRTTPPSNGDLTCPTDTPFIYMPYPKDCNKFYYCVDGVNVGTWSCGQGLWFNFEQQACNFPWGSSCQ